MILSSWSYFCLDITSLNLNTNDGNTEFEFTGFFNSITNDTGKLTLSLSNSQVEKIKFTDSSSEVHDSASTIADNATYTVGSNLLTIDIIDVP